MDRLVGEVTTRYGLVPSRHFHDSVEGMRRADQAIRSVLIPDPDRSEEQRTRDFWHGCSMVGDFLGKMHRRGWEYFQRWDPALITIRGSC